MILILAVGMHGRLEAAVVTPKPRDTLVYKDGDRVQGTLIDTAGGVIVFQSDRFGELRVSASHAVVIKGEKADPPALAPKPPVIPPALPATPAEKVRAVAAAEQQKEEERVTIWDQFSPSVLTAKVRNYFGPWHGRLTFSAEVVSDIAERNNSSYEAHLKRKWKSDEVQMTLRYDYNETNDLATTDLMKASGQWRREFTKTLFAHYRPSGEWNRASRLRGVPNDYILLQQELGFGYHLLTKPSRKLRLGLSQNLFDTWNTAPDGEHSTRGVISSFEEAELTLPWRMTLSQRGVWYPGNDEADGWENRIELVKKLTETLSTSVRHEIRRNNPDGSAQDYARLKLLFGLDF
ncbi:MAG: DUF481 domain-containing protein [Opitutaceae bacterium]